MTAVTNFFICSWASWLWKRHQLGFPGQRHSSCSDIVQEPPSVTRTLSRVARFWRRGGWFLMTGQGGKVQRQGVLLHQCYWLCWADTLLGMVHKRWQILPQNRLWIELRSRCIAFLSDWPPEELRLPTGEPVMSWALLLSW
jgi:hypothetical protein